MRSWIENELIELINFDQFGLSIPIQFQFKIFQFNSNSIHAELNWIDYQFQFNSWIDPSPDCIALLFGSDRIYPPPMTESNHPLTEIFQPCLKSPCMTLFEFLQFDW